MTDPDPRPFFEHRPPGPPPASTAKPPPLSPAMFARRDGTCQDCGREPVVPYNRRCQACAVRVAKRGAPGEGRA